MNSLSRPLLRSAILVLALTGCQSVQQEKGNILEPEMVAQIKPGTTTQRMVRELLGSPTTINTFRDNRWIYIQDRRFEGNRAVNRVEITFDKGGVVSQVDRNFANELLDPTTLSEDGGSRAASIWRRLKRDETEHEVGVKEGLARVGAVPPPSSASEEKELAKAKLTWVDKYILLRKPAPPTEVQNPSTRFSSAEAGWWRNIWSEDPTKPVRQFAPGDRDPIESARPDTNSNLPAFATQRRDDPAGASSPPTARANKPWWRFWSND